MDLQRWSIIGFTGLLLAALVVIVAVTNHPEAIRPSAQAVPDEPAAPTPVKSFTQPAPAGPVSARGNVAPEPTPEIVDQPASPPGSVRGTVVDHARRPLAGIVVLLLDGAFRQEALTDAAGEYRFERAYPGISRVEPLLPDLLRLQTGPGELRVESGTEAVAAPIVLSTLVRLTVRLLDATGNPTKGRDRAGRRLHVVAAFSSPPSRLERLEGVVDDTGTATFAAVPADAIEFSLNVIGYRATGDLPLRLLDDRDNDAGDVRLFELETLETDPAPLLGGLSGRVVDESSGSLAKITIVAHRVSDKDDYGRTHRSDERVVTGNDGKFTFETLPVGRWYLNVMDREWAVVSEPVVIEVEAGQIATAADFVLRPAVGVRIRFLDQDGKPVQGFVTGGFSGGETSQTQIADIDSNGFAVFMHVPEHATEVRLLVNGYEAAKPLPVRPVNDSLVDGGTVTLTRKLGESNDK